MHHGEVSQTYRVVLHRADLGPLTAHTLRRHNQGRRNNISAFSSGTNRTQSQRADWQVAMLVTDSGTHLDVVLSTRADLIRAVLSASTALPARLASTPAAKPKNKCML